MSTLPASIRSLILDEQARLENQFIAGVELEGYLGKLGDSAEILSDCAGSRCRGFVAFYCNDTTTRQAYITLVLVDPGDRGTGLGGALVGAVLEIARRRGFTSCRLEVAKRNEAARALYVSLGFRVVEDRAEKDLLEIAL
jgi:ribosomal protein S18 acetylase RimI-like enzyme